MTGGVERKREMLEQNWWWLWPVVSLCVGVVWADAVIRPILGDKSRESPHHSWFVPGSLVGIKDIDFVGRSEAETP